MSMSDTPRDQHALIKRVASAVTAQPKKPLSICIDISGGITTGMRSLFRRITTQIAEQNDTDIHLFFFDTKTRHAFVRGPHQVGAAMDYVLQEYGGGTNFDVAFRAADAPDPSLIIAFSDMLGFINYVPKAPLLWAVPNGDGHHAPPSAPGTVLYI